MFDDLPETRKVRSKGKGKAFTFALIAHVVALTGIGVANLLALEQIEPPPISVVFLSAAAPPPPPPPPPPAKPKPKEEAPKPQTEPKPVPQVAQPMEMPSTLPDVKTEEVAPDFGMEGGVEGGVEGGIEGGVLGGVDGGVVGGVEGSDEPLRVGGDVEAPEIVKQVQPRYPEVAKAARASGLVILEAIINTEGVVEDVKVLRGHPLLQQAAMDAIVQWKFKPGRLNGKPVRVVFTLTVNFQLK